MVNDEFTPAAEVNPEFTAAPKARPLYLDDTQAIGAELRRRRSAACMSREAVGAQALILGRQVSRFEQGLCMSALAKAAALFGALGLRVRLVLEPMDGAP